MNHKAYLFVSIRRLSNLHLPALAEYLEGTVVQVESLGPRFLLFTVRNTSHLILFIPDP